MVYDEWFKELPKSHHTPEETLLCFVACEALRGPLTGQPEVCTAEELKDIIELGQPYSKDCNFLIFRTSYKPDGGAPAAKMRVKYPHLDFSFEEKFLHGGEQGKWWHMLTIRRKAGAIGAPATGGQLEARVPDPVPPVMHVQAPDGRLVQVNVPPGTAPGSVIKVAY
mmetsp:Transcript_9175/g.20439  ORF Transcript_9175/g.20439 Transcript_9175/m.20439 type:complete len:167 (+) Transcript_9175:89-589(+)